MTLLQRIQEQRERTRESLRIVTLNSLRDALRELLPEQPVLVFGSVIRPRRFRPDSDIDLGLYAEPADRSIFRFQVEMEERLHRRVDVLLLAESRLRDSIERQGERWMN